MNSLLPKLLYNRLTEIHKTAGIYVTILPENPFPFLFLLNLEFWNFKVWVCGYRYAGFDVMTFGGYVFLSTDFMYLIRTIQFIMCIVFKYNAEGGGGLSFFFLFIEHLYDYKTVSHIKNLTFLIFLYLLTLSNFKINNFQKWSAV